MNELETIQPQENVESTETTEAVEQQTLQEAAVEPGTRVEETQTFEQAEAVEGALVEAVEPPGQPEAPPPCPDEPKDLPPGSGVLVEPHETVAMAEPLEERGIVEQAEIPEGMQFELASEGDDDGKDEATPINLPGPESAEEDDEGMQLISGPNRDDLPDGTGILEEPHETVEMADKPEERGVVDTAEVPEGIEFQLAGEDGTVGRDDDGLIKDPELSEASGNGDDGKDEATPINLPGPVAAVADEPDHGPSPFTQPAQVAKDHPGTGGNVAGHKEPGDPPPPPDLRGQTALSPDDVKAGENLQPAPDYEDMNPSERAVVDVIGKAITDEAYRAALFADAREATAGYAVSDEDRAGLGEMTAEAFDFFAAEVENRFAEAAGQQTLAQVVHSVWRDLNPGGLVYVLTYKIPQKHLS